MKHPLAIQNDVDIIGSIPAITTMLEVICRTTGMGFAAVARVTEQQWVACAVRDEIEFGLVPGGALQLETTICHEIRQHPQPVIIDHVQEDTHYALHHTPELYGFQSYISFPVILKDGSFFGTLCAIDPNPARLNNPETIGMFKLFADLIAFHLQAFEDAAQTRRKLLEEQQNAGLREQFIAILGHDLGNPVNAIASSAQLLSQMALEEQALSFVNIIQKASYRITGLIDNVLDFAAGRLGEGIQVNRQEEQQLADTLLQVIAELQVVHSDRGIEHKIELTTAVNCDAKRIAQLFSNLLGNALKYGDAGHPIIVEAVSDASGFQLSVSNIGPKISEEAMDRLFQPFSRGEVEANQEGLGLGLYIAAQIAYAHEGTLEVDSLDKVTTFRLTLPPCQN